MKQRLPLLVLAFALAASCLVAGCANASKDVQPVTIAVWTYYNGDQLNAFNSLVSEFNETVGAEKGIVVESSNVGSVDDLRDAVVDSANGIVGAEPLPNVFMTYADTAYAIDQMGLLVDLGPYLSEEDRALFVEGYLEEGTLGDAGSIKIFPIAKSVEVLLLNQTDFEPFAAEAGVTYEDLSTFEGVVEVAQKYYEWTDAKTPEEHDGKAFIGRDSMANYFFIGAKQLGVDIISVEDGEVALDFNKEVARKLWDNYYVPYVKGYFNETGHYRSDDVKTGTIISLVGSSPSATFFPTEVILDSGEEYSISSTVLPAPQFAGGQAWAVQQGAGMAVIDASEEEVQASVEFLKWFAEPSQNVQFCVSSGYLPVMKEANSIDAVRALAGELEPGMEEVLDVAMGEVADNALYTPRAFEHGTEFRNMLEYSLGDLASSDYQVICDQVASGVDYELAIAPFLEDAHFDQWYESLLAQLEVLVR